MTSGRACTPYNEGDMQRCQHLAVRLMLLSRKPLQLRRSWSKGKTLSSTVLNNWASTWDSTVYPFDDLLWKDYFDGRGIAAPDVDNNCQIE